MACFYYSFTNHTHILTRTVHRKLDFEVGFATSAAFTVQQDYEGK